jgi:hypothetical protein
MLPSSPALTSVLLACVEAKRHRCFEPNKRNNDGQQSTARTKRYDKDNEARHELSDKGQRSTAVTQNTASGNYEEEADNKIQHGTAEHKQGQQITARR